MFATLLAAAQANPALVLVITPIVVAVVTTLLYKEI